MDSLLDVKLIDVLHLARQERDLLGVIRAEMGARDAARSSERWRQLSLVVTKLEEAVLWLTAEEGLA